MNKREFLKTATIGAGLLSVNPTIFATNKTSVLVAKPEYITYLIKLFHASEDRIKTKLIRIDRESHNLNESFVKFALEYKSFCEDVRSKGVEIGRQTFNRRCWFETYFQVFEQWFDTDVDKTISFNKYQIPELPHYKPVDEGTPNHDSKR